MPAQKVFHFPVWSKFTYHLLSSITSSFTTAELSKVILLF